MNVITTFVLLTGEVMELKPIVILRKCVNLLVYIVTIIGLF